MIPPQTIDRRRIGRTPEMRLVAAMLDDAVRSVVCNVDAQRGPRRRAFLDARHWLGDNARTWPFAFANVCDLLDLDATVVRARLKKMVSALQRGLDEAHGQRATAAAFEAPKRARLALDTSTAIGR